MFLTNKMSTITQFDPEVLNLEDLGLHVAGLTAILSGYKEAGIEAPAKFVEALETAKRTLGYKADADKRYRLKKLEAQLDGLKTADEKKADLLAQVEALRKELG